LVLGLSWELRQERFWRSLEDGFVEVTVIVIQTFSGYGWLLVPTGLFLGLLGYRIYRISLFLIALFAGLMLGEWFGSRTDNSQLYLILGLVTGAIIGLISHFLIKLSLFVLGMAGGFVLSSFIIEQTGLDLKTIGELILMSISALISGVFTVWLYRSLIIFFTSIIGTFLIYQATIHFFPPNSDNWSWILYVILLSLFIIVQASARKHHSDPIRKNERHRNR